MTDRISLIAIMEAMAQDPPRKRAGREVYVPEGWYYEEVGKVEDLKWLVSSVERSLRNLKPSNTKAQLLEGIEEARAILEGGR